jgi:uncharacterized protein
LPENQDKDVKPGDDLEKAEEKPEEPIESDRPAEAIVQRLPGDMRATVQVIPPTGEAAHVDNPMLRAAIAAKKITFGIDEEALAKIVAERLYGKVVTIARGEEPTNGNDATLVFHYDKFLHRQDKSMDNLGQVDYKELDKIINTDPGQLLLEKTPPTEGTPGQTIAGKKVRQVRGKDVRLRARKGVRVEGDGTKFFSETSGQVVFRNDQISVENAVEFENVDAETGNIHFKGAVIVKGNVEDGFVVESTADVRVKGTVGAAKIIAVGDVAIMGGVFGKGHAEIVSTEGTVYVKFSQDAKIRAAKDIVIDEYARNSDLRAGERLNVVNENELRGRILGGSASAAEEIHCNNLGSDMEIATRVAVGVSKEDLDRISELERGIKKRFENLSNLTKSVFILQREKAKTGKLDERKFDINERLLETLRRMRSVAEVEIIELSGLFQGFSGKKSYLHVKNRISPNVEIHLQMAQMVVRKAISFATLCNEENEVHVKPYMQTHEKADDGNDPAETDQG